jgi:hypothetical protein
MGLFYLFYTFSWAVQLTARVFNLGISLICWFRVIMVFFCVFAVFTAEVTDGVGDKRSEDTTFDVQRLLVTL